MLLPERFSYTQSPQFPGLARLPFVPLTLSPEQRSLSRMALVDFGSTVNVLPYDVGLELGLSWEKPIFPQVTPFLQNDRPMHPMFDATQPWCWSVDI